MFQSCVFPITPITYQYASSHWAHSLACATPTLQIPADVIIWQFLKHHTHYFKTSEGGYVNSLLTYLCLVNAQNTNRVHCDQQGPIWNKSKGKAISFPGRLRGWPGIYMEDCQIVPCVSIDNNDASIIKDMEVQTTCFLQMEYYWEFSNCVSYQVSTAAHVWCCHNKLLSSSALPHLGSEPSEYPLMPGSKCCPDRPACWAAHLFDKSTGQAPALLTTILLSLFIPI